MVHPGGFEPPTARFVAEYSIQLSYGCIGTADLLLTQCRSTCRNIEEIWCIREDYSPKARPTGRCLLKQRFPPWCMLRALSSLAHYHC